MTRSTTLWRHLSSLDPDQSTLNIVCTLHPFFAHSSIVSWVRHYSHHPSLVSPVPRPRWDHQYLPQRLLHRTLESRPKDSRPLSFTYPRLRPCLTFTLVVFQVPDLEPSSSSSPYFTLRPRPIASPDVRYHSWYIPLSFLPFTTVVKGEIVLTIVGSPDITLLADSLKRSEPFR